jgi:predicted phosphodiesterase
MADKTVGIIGDVHAEDRALINVVTFFKDAGVDAIYSTGDLCDGYGSTENVINFIKKSKIQCVRGNHDLWCITGEMRDLPGAVESGTLSLLSQQYLRQMPYVFLIDTVTGPALLCHGILNNIMGRVTDDDCEGSLETNLSFQEFVEGSYPQIMINGHSHRRMVKCVRGKTIINAGTLFRDHSPCVSIIDFEKRVVTFYPVADSKIAAYRVEVGEF